MIKQSIVKLKDLCITITDGSHYSPKGVKKGIPMLSVKDMRSNGFDYTECKQISREEYENLCKNSCHPEKNDVLIAKDGSYLKEIFVVKEEKEEAILSSIGILKPNLKLVDPYYIKYYLSSDFVKQQVAKKYVSGSALPRIILKNFANIEIPYIDIEKQRKIVNILKTIDDKIENNNKIILEIESLNKTIYDYWFLQYEFPNAEGKPYKSNGGEMVYNDELKKEIPKEWSNGFIKDIGNVIAGGTPSTEHSEYYTDNGISWITPKDLAETTNKYINKGTRDITELGLKNSSANLLPKGTVLLTSRAPIGYIGISTQEVTTNQGFKSIVPKDGYNSEYVYYTINSMIPYLKNLGVGSTFSEISKDTVEKVKTIIPPKNIVDTFGNKIKNIAIKQELLEKENQELIKLRDYLLPLLMNGQVSFKN